QMVIRGASEPSPVASMASPGLAAPPGGCWRGAGTRRRSGRRPQSAPGARARLDHLHATAPAGEGVGGRELHAQVPIRVVELQPRDALAIVEDGEERRPPPALGAPTAPAAGRSGYRSARPLGSAR